MDNTLILGKRRNYKGFIVEDKSIVHVKIYRNNQFLLDIKSNSINTVMNYFYRMDNDININYGYSSTLVLFLENEINEILLENITVGEGVEVFLNNKDIISLSNVNFKTSLDKTMVEIYSRGSINGVNINIEATHLLIRNNFLNMNSCTLSIRYLNQINFMLDEGSIGITSDLNIDTVDNLTIIFQSSTKNLYKPIYIKNNTIINCLVTFLNSLDKFHLPPFTISKSYPTFFTNNTELLSSELSYVRNITYFNLTAFYEPMKLGIVKENSSLEVNAVLFISMDSYYNINVNFIIDDKLHSLESLEISYEYRNPIDIRIKYYVKMVEEIKNHMNI